MMTLRELIATASKSAELVFRKDSEIAPLYHMLKPDGTSLIWSPAVSGLGDKDEIVAAARMIMRELQIALRYLRSTRRDAFASFLRLGSWRPRPARPKRWLRSSASAKSLAPAHIPTGARS